MSRPVILRIAAGLAFLLVLAWFVWPERQSTPPTTGNAIVIGNAGEPGTLDPHKYSLVLEQQILEDLFVGLTMLNAKAEIVPGIAQSWMMSGDGQTWTFHLRKGLKWSDGAPLTAEDMVAGLRRAFDPKTHAVIASLGYKIRNARLVHEGKLPLSALGVRAPDGETVEISLEHPSAVLPEVLADPQFSPLPRQALARYGDAWTKPGTMIGNGPYRLVEWRPGERVRLVKNPHFFDAAHVAIEQADYVPADDAAAAFKRFRSGEFDVTIPFPLDEIPWIRTNMPGALRVHAGSYVRYLAINLALPQFRDVRVRRALSLAIDREFIAHTLLRTAGDPAYRVVPPGVADYPSDTGLDFRALSMAVRVAEARKLVREAGFGPDHPLSFTYRYQSGASSQRIAAVLQQEWKAIGAEVSLQRSDSRTHFAELTNRNFEVADAAWTFWPDPEYFLLILDASNRETNYNDYANPRFSELVARARIELDRKRRMTLYGDAERTALADNPLIPLVFLSMRVLASSRVTGVEANVLGVYPLREMRLKP